jgi:heme-degrading monooxygenase HmoA
MTFYSESARMIDLVETLRSEIPPAYEAIPGFRGLQVLEKPGANHVIALTLWEDEEAVEASADLAEDKANRIAHAIGTSVSRNIYNVLGSIHIPEDRPDPM